MEPEECRRSLDRLNCIVILPTYNNAQTILQVIENVHEYSNHIMVVNDGSSDATHELLTNRDDIILIEYADNKNRGKGFALKTALRRATEIGYRYAITMDSDGQHFANDIPNFIEAIEQEPDSLIIGSRNLQADGMPSKNTFANKFSNFWFKVETWKTLSDTQSGYRLYPLTRIKNMRFFTPRYEFEVEIIVRSVWRGINAFNVPIKVLYPKDRVTHFRPLQDFTRISILNTILVTLALIYYYPKCFIKWIIHPKNIIDFFDKNLIHSGESNMRLSCAVGFGIFMGIIPIWGFQMLVAVTIAHILKLNKIIVIAFSNISIPPMIPFIIFGSLWMGGFILNRPTLIDIDTITIDSALESLTQYILGSIVFAIISGISAWLLSYIILSIANPKHKKGLD